MHDPFFDFSSGIQSFLDTPNIDVRAFTAYKCKPDCPSWDPTINCLCTKVDTLFLKTTCGAPNGPPGEALSKDDPGRYKVFVKGFKNLCEYAMACLSGKVGKETHMLLGRFVSRSMDGMPEDLKKKDPYYVDTLNFKFACGEKSGGKNCGYAR